MMPEWKPEIRQRLRNLKLEPTREAEIVEELEQHLNDRSQELRARGATEETAYHAALAELSQSPLLEQELRRVEQPVRQEPVVLGVGRRNMIADIWQDLRYAVRGVRKHALLSVAVIATLTLGIGISTGVFTFFNAVALRARVDEEPESFTRVYSSYTTDPTRPGGWGTTTLDDYLAFRDHAHSLREAVAQTGFRPAFEDDPREVRVILTTCNFFSLYTLKEPKLGRLLQTEDCSAARPVVVLSEALWRSRYGADPKIIGKAVHINRQPVTVIGVTPTFSGQVNNAQAWLPYTLQPYLQLGNDLLAPTNAPRLMVEARVRPGFSRRDVAAELAVLSSQQDRLHPERKSAVLVTDGSGLQDPNARRQMVAVLVLLLFTFLLIVLIACANVTNLLLSRAETRQKEIAIRLALGAGRLRLIRMLLTEALLLACLAGPGSLYLSYWLPEALNLWLLTEPFRFSLAPDWRVFSFLAALTLLSGVIAGLAPARQALRVNLVDSLKGRRNLLGSVAGGRLRGFLVGAQVAMSFMLLVGAGLFLRTHQQMTAVNPGYETKQVLGTRLWVRGQEIPLGSWTTFHRRVIERIQALPGVQAIAYAMDRPYNNMGRQQTIAVSFSGQGARPIAYNAISPGFFKTLGIPLLSGRALSENDPPCGQQCSIIVSQALAREFWPGTNPLGQTLVASDGTRMEIVGVARDISTQVIGEPDGPLIYFSWNPNVGGPEPMVRFTGDEKILARTVTAAIREILPSADVQTQTIQDEIDLNLLNVWRFEVLISILSILAVFLAVIGIYGVLSFAVSQRTKELGIRFALGAQKKDIYGTVLGFSARPIVIGLVIGVPLAFGVAVALGRLLQMINAPFAVKAGDPLAYALAVVLFVTVALAAMFGPARRAVRVDPMVALREE